MAVRSSGVAGRIMMFCVIDSILIKPCTFVGGSLTSSSAKLVCGRSGSWLKLYSGRKMLSSLLLAGKRILNQSRKRRRASRWFRLSGQIPHSPPQAPGGWRSPRRFAPLSSRRPTRQRPGLRRPSAAFPRRTKTTNYLSESQESPFHGAVDKFSSGPHHAAGFRQPHRT